MKLNFTKSDRFFPRQFLRRAGYAEISNREGEVSYARVFGPGGYPRFHVYLEETSENFTINLHLDQKKPVYAGHTAHNGEYDGEVIEGEAARIRAIILG